MLLLELLNVLFKDGVLLEPLAVLGGSFLQNAVKRLHLRMNDFAVSYQVLLLIHRKQKFSLHMNHLVR